MLDPSLTVVLATLDAFDKSSEAQDIEKLTSSIVALFVANDAAVPLIKKMISREVSCTGTFISDAPLFKLIILCTVDPTTLFRSNSIPTKMLAAMTKLIGNDYIKDAVQKPIQYVCSPDCPPIEVRPWKLSMNIRI